MPAFSILISSFYFTNKTFIELQNVPLPL